MPSVPTAKVLAPGEGKTIELFAVVEAEAGASMVKPRGIPHAMWNVGAEPARVLEVLSPGGLEDYFEELSPVLRAKAPPSEYDALAHRYGLTIQNDWIEELERTYGVKR